MVFTYVMNVVDITWLEWRRMCEDIEEMQRSNQKQWKEREGDSNWYGGRQQQKGWYVHSSSVVLRHVDDGFGKWQRERWEGVEWIVQGSWIWWLQDLSHIGFQVSYRNLPMTLSSI